MILITGISDKTSANVLDMYRLIVYIMGLKQQHDDTWKEVQMMMSKPFSKLLHTVQFRQLGFFEVHFIIIIIESHCIKD